LQYRAIECGIEQNLRGWASKLAGALAKEVAMDNSTKRSPDQDMHKGAKEDDRPGPEHSNHPGLDKKGLPNDPTAIAQDALGANEDRTQG
jgi:hypothetical protein